MERVSVEDVYRRVVSARAAHCGVCLRAAPRARLVRPAHLAALLAQLRLHALRPVEVRVCRACVSCERLAQHALRCLAALRCAARAAALFQQMALRDARAPHQLQPSVVEEVEEQLTALRARARLVQTEVLVVDSTGLCAGGHGQLGETPSSSAANMPLWRSDMETVVLDDDDDLVRSAPAAPVANPAAPIANAIVPLANPSAPMLQLAPLVSLYEGAKVMFVPAADSSPQQNGLIFPFNVNNKQEDVILIIDNGCNAGDQVNNILEMMLQEKAVEDDGQVKRARLGSGSRDLHSATRVVSEGNGAVNQGLQVVNQGNSVVNKGLQIVDQGNSVVNQGLQVVNQGSSVVSKGRQIVNKGNSVISKGRRGVNRGNSAVNQRNRVVGNMVPQTARERSASPRLRIESCRGSEGRGAGPGAGGQGAGHTYMVDIDDIADLIKEQSKKEEAAQRDQQQCEARPAARAVPAAGRSVDWEDKIPMDVISFVDATDPNSAELMVPATRGGRGPRGPGPPAPGPPVIDLC